MRPKVVLVTAITLIMFVSPAWGVTTDYYTIQKPLVEYGHVSQLDPGIINGNAACGPTATINSFIYLQNHYGLTGLVPGDPIDAVNELGRDMGLTAGGVTDDNFVTGKRTYLDLYAPGQIYMHGVDDQGAGGLTMGIPSWQFIYEELSACEDVEVGFSWVGESSGHWITATSFHFTDNDGDQTIDASETATLDFIDPWGGVETPAVELLGTLTMGNDGFLNLTYAGGAAGGGATGRIDIVVSESPVPEPLTMVSAFLAVSGLGAYLRKRVRPSRA